MSQSFVLPCCTSLVGNRAQGLLGKCTAGEKVAVEVDGPHHFTVNGQKPLGEMCARHRLLDVRGWSVLSVPYFVWTTQADDAAHIVFLRQVCVCAWHVADSLQQCKHISTLLFGATSSIQNEAGAPKPVLAVNAVLWQIYIGGCIHLAHGNIGPVAP